MRQRIRIIFEYLAAFTLIALLLMAITGVVVVKFYEKQLQEFVMDQVNRRLDSKVEIGDASVRVFHKFPQTSMVLTDVTVWSSHNFRSHDFQGEGADTLLTADAVSINFNPFALLRKKYNIRQFEISHGILHVYTDSRGEGNYRIISSENRDEPKEEQQLNLSQLKITDFRVILDNRAKMLTSSGTLHHLELDGKFSRGKTQLRGNLEGYLEETSNKGILYASEREVKARLQMDVNDSLYTIESGHLQIDRILADVDGQFRIFRGRGVDLDIYATARDLEIHEVLDLLPRKLSNPLQEIRGSGILQLYTRIKGRVSTTLTPQIEADFQTSDADLQWNRLPFSVRSLNLTGT
ncbi:MAG: AsmA family protein, partial [Bacteroidales bacterium]